MNDTSIDNNSFNFLKHLYECNECSVKELARFLGIKDISGIPELISIALPLFESEHLVIKHPKLTYADSISFEAYKFACERNSVPLFTPDCVIGILPKGRVFVEEKIQKQEEFEKQFNALQIIAESSLEHSKTAKEHALAAESIAQTAQESSDSSTKYAKISAALSIIAIIISIVAIALPLLFG